MCVRVFVPPEEPLGLWVPTYTPHHTVRTRVRVHVRVRIRACAQECICLCVMRHTLDTYDGFAALKVSILHDQSVHRQECLTQGVEKGGDNADAVGGAVPPNGSELRS